MWVGFGPNVAKFAPEVAKVLQMSTEVGSNFDQLGPNSAKFGVVWTETSQLWDNFGRKGSMLAELRPVLGRNCAELCQIRPTLDPVRPMSGQRLLHWDRS